MVHNSAVKLFVVFRFLPSRSLYKSPFSTSVSTLYQAMSSKPQSRRRDRSPLMRLLHSLSHEELEASSLYCAIRSFCEGGMNFSSRACGWPPCKIPTRFMASSCSTFLVSENVKSKRRIGGHYEQRSNDHTHHQRTRL
jgi:hypothetical protein